MHIYLKILVKKIILIKKLLKKYLKSFLLSLTSGGRRRCDCARDLQDEPL